MENVIVSDYGIENELEVNGYPKNLTITFPAGEKLSVPFKLLNSYYLPIISKDNISDYVNILIGLSENDNPAISAEIFSILDGCSNAPRTKKEYDLSVDNIEKEANGDIEELLYLLKFDYRICENVTDEQIENRSVWKDKAIELGDYNSLLELAVLNRDEQMEIYQRLWDLGHSGIGIALAEKYTNRENPDYMTAYAYHLASNITFEQAYIENESSSSSGLLKSMDTSLSISASRLSPSEQAEAESLAFKLLSENEKCCLGIWDGY